MKPPVLFILILLTLFGSLVAQAEQATDSRFPVFNTRDAAQHRCPFDIVVIVNTASDSYSVDGPAPTPGDKTVAYMCQRDADQMDYHFNQK